MSKENEILQLANKNRGIVTTKEVTENNIARIYLNKLLNENKIYRISRGIYSINKIDIDPLYAMQHRTKKVIFSHFTSLNLQNFYKDIEKKVQISVPQSYNAKNYRSYKVFYDSKSNYGQGIIKLNYKGHILRIYDIERSVCDIIRDRSRFDTSEYNKFINYYFNKLDLNYKKLLEYSKALRISKLVHHYLSLFKA